MRRRSLALLPLLCMLACSTAATPSSAESDALTDAPGDEATTTLDDASPGDGASATDTRGSLGDALVDSGTPSAATLIVEPDDGQAAILDAISGAKKSVHVVMYLLTDTDAIKALIAAKKAGREVSVLLEKSPYPSPTENQTAFNDLTAGGVKVTWSSKLYALTHEKVLIVDGSTAYVMTLNLTFSGLRSNREYAARVTDPADVAEAEALFAADVVGMASPSLGSGKLVVSPVNSRSKIVALIDSATKTLDIEMEEMSDDASTARIAAALARGVKVRIVVPSSTSAATAAKVADLRAKGASIHALGSPDIHAKVIVADAARAYLGSENLTFSSLDRNREVGVITDSPPTIARIETTIAADFAKGS